MDATFCEKPTEKISRYANTQSVTMSTTPYFPDVILTLKGKATRMARNTGKKENCSALMKLSYSFKSRPAITFFKLPIARHQSSIFDLLQFHTLSSVGMPGISRAMSGRL